MIAIKQAKIVLLALILSAVLASCGQGANGATSAQNTNSSQADDVVVKEIFADATELSVNPLTGEELADGIENGTRPIAIMVNNSKVSLPQRGIAGANAVVEMSTEGGITRLMAMYANPSEVPQVGSVRSARDQHLQFAMPVNAITVHIGTSIYANNLLNTYGYKTIDGHYQGTTSFWFDELRATSRANEHCWYTDAALIAAGVQREQLPTTGASYTLVNFKAPDENAVMPSGGDAPNVSFNFSDTNTAQFVYDSATGTYKKFVFSAEHRDEEGEQLSFSNVLVLFAQVGLKDDEYCLDYNLSAGTGYYFTSGKYEQIIWEKGNPEQPLIIKDVNGNIYNINTGKTYIGVAANEQAQSLVFDFNAAS